MRNCYLCGEKASAKRGFFVPTLLGWKHMREYLCRKCYNYWMREAKASFVKGAKAY